MTQSDIDLYEKMHLVANNYSSRTRYVYLRSLASFLSFVKDAPLTRTTLLSYKDHLSAMHLSSQTKNILIIPVRSLLTFMNQRNENAPIDFKDALSTFKDRGGTKYHVNLPSQEESSSFLSALNGENYLIARIALATGMRISEIISLESNQVQEEFSVVGKGSKQRPIMCTPEVVALVREYENTIDSRKLFKTTPNKVQRAFRQASGGTITPHTLRHLFATKMVESGVDIRYVQEFLGHASITTTQRYTQISNTRLSDVYKKVMV